VRSGPAGPARPYLIRSISRSRYLSALRSRSRSTGRLVCRSTSLDRHFRHFEGWRTDTGDAAKRRGIVISGTRKRRSPIDFPENRKKKDRRTTLALRESDQQRPCLFTLVKCAGSDMSDWFGFVLFFLWLINLSLFVCYIYLLLTRLFALNLLNVRVSTVFCNS